ncbi:hypothetical protein C3L23_08785 [Nautilia sp. PV-1]|uniref:hypothetical protein n=1 Tax=Nautilia sp. PV-1 TaxID=2579250 RepID=UPI000FD7A377|nr:hypothetical protein [Nautilia sp. PV-1]AZV47364.1 hypothetical protein C3L23_08785 [Nautilia sp. PV-1]
MFKRFKKFHKKTLKYKVLLGFLVGMGIAIFLILLMLTPVGSAVLKKVIETKIDKYMPGTEITYLDYGVNNFSLVAKKGHNVVKIYGALFPFNAMFEGNVQKLSDLSPYFQGKMNLSGKIYTDRNNIVIDGMSFFANGYMNFKVNIDDKVDMDAKGSDFNLQKILYMLKIDYPWVSGQTDMQINKHNSVYKAVFKTTGEYKNRIKTDFKAVTDLNIKNHNVSFNSNIESGIGNIILNGRIFNDYWESKFKAENLDLNKLQPILLYPFKEKTDMHGIYESSNGVLKFKGDNFEGFADSRIELTFKMNGKQFFSHIGVMQILDGDISGTVKIYDKLGTFDIVSNNTKFLNNKLIKKIYYLTGINLSKENTGKVFFKGMFDNKHAVFDMLSTNQNISISIKKGEFTYPDKYHIIVYLRKGNNVFKLLLENGKIKVLEKRDFRQVDNKILVF